MKLLPQKPLPFQGAANPSGLSAEWPDRSALTLPTAVHALERIKSIGFSSKLDDYDKRKLGIFNQLNFFQLVTGIVIPVAGAVSNRHFPLLAWIVACMPALISIVVLFLNSRRRYVLAQIAYFVCYPIATSIVYIWGINMGVELSFILYGILSVFFIQDLSQMLFALGLSMVSYFVLAVVCTNYNYQLETASPLFYLLNQLLAIVFIFYGLFLVKKENAGYQQNIQRQSDELAQLNSFKNRLFSIIAHDLKTPVYALRNLFRNMQQLDLPAEEIKAMVPEVVNELTYTTSLMENVLHWARSQMRADAVRPQPVDIAELMTEVMRQQRLQADAKQIAVVQCPTAGLIAFADKDMVHLILRNLLSNAIKYTPEKGTIEVGARPHPTGVAIFVKDNGTGIQPDELGKIQLSNFYTTKGTAGEAGTGLGLMLCKECIARNGGELLIDSLPGKGSTFTFTLPASE
jgi:two-component system, sensor histidine kinase and response regulator